MADILHSTFEPLFLSILKIIIIAFAAGILVRKKIVTQQHIDSLSKITVYVFLPCMIFAKILLNFNPAEMTIWWSMPLIGASMILLGLAVAYLLFIKAMPKKKDFLALASMQNAGYLVLPIGQSVYPDQFDTFAVYVFLFVLGLNPLLWSVGKYLISGKDGSTIKLKEFFNPPLISNVLALLFVLTTIKRYVPEIIIDSIDFLGSATVPVVTFVLGATLGGISLRQFPAFWDCIRVFFVKFLLLPATTILFIYYSGIYQDNILLANFFMIQAAAAPATGTILQARTYGGNMQRVGSTIFLSYFICVLAIPIWVTMLKILP
jgi:malate permease and related proteins